MISLKQETKFLKKQGLSREEIAVIKLLRKKDYV